VKTRQSLLSDALVRECRMKLIETRQDILNRVRSSRAEFETLDKSGGDEADQTMSLIAEHDFLASQQRLSQLLLEVDLALSRIENGSYGVCEETDEPIEMARLKVIPWTRLSIEGAEIREAMRRKYAR
jgi:DnaK suppressor protein